MVLASHRELRAGCPPPIQRWFRRCLLQLPEDNPTETSGVGALPGRHRRSAGRKSSTSLLAAPRDQPWSHPCASVVTGSRGSASWRTLLSERVCRRSGFRSTARSLASLRCPPARVRGLTPGRRSGGRPARRVGVVVPADRYAFWAPIMRPVRPSLAHWTLCLRVLLRVSVGLRLPLGGLVRGFRSATARPPFSGTSADSARHCAGPGHRLRGPRSARTPRRCSTSDSGRRRRTRRHHNNRLTCILLCENYGIKRYPRNTHFLDSRIYLSHLPCLK